MLRRLLLVSLFCIFLMATAATGQDLCPAGKVSDKLVCVIPGVYGPNGLSLDANGHQGHFEESFLTSSLEPLNSAIGSQSTLLPLASPTSGITFSWDPVAKVFAASTDSFGPILGERAETIGRHKLALGFSYQHFKFDSLDGINLNRLPAVYTHQDDSVDGPPGTTCSINAPNPSPSNTDGCGFVRDVVNTNNRIDLKIHQYTTFITFGLTDRIDVSVAIPIENVRMGLFSNATIVNNSNSGDHIFPPSGNCSAPCFNSSFSNVRNASGIGDIILRAKGTAWKGERAAVALGVDVRVPTGDKLNFLGSGAAGVRPFVVWSYRSRVSPHVVVGYETNGSSVLAGDISTGSEARLPSQLTYSGGADVWLTKWFTAAFDLIGQQVFQAQRITIDPNFQDLGPCVPFSGPGYCTTSGPPNQYSNLSHLTGSYNISNASLGVKIRPVAGLLITGNVQIKLNDGGLRANFTPLVGVSYTF